jgi:hypothetical protein
MLAIMVTQVNGLKNGDPAEVIQGAIVMTVL